MKKMQIALILFALAGGVATFVLHGPDEPTPRPAITRGRAPKVRKMSGPAPAPLPVVVADRILIEKSARSMTLFSDGKPINKYRVALGREPEGKKTTEGDCKTPEGCYTIDYRNENSSFYRALHISYPNEQDRQQAAELGVSPGNGIMIHGLKNGMGWVGKGHLVRDWTLGCIAVTNREMDEIWRLTPVGTKVEIVP